MIILSNCLSLIASVLSIVATRLDSKKKIIFTQTVGVIVTLAAQCVLQQYLSSIATLLVLLRNFLISNDLMNKRVCWTIIAAMVISSIVLHPTLLYLLPIVSTAGYTYGLVYCESVQNLRLVMVVNNFCWFVYGISVGMYVSGNLNLVLMISTMTKYASACRKELSEL